MQLAPLSYSLCIMLKDRIYAVRDPYGNRPLCLGKIYPNPESKFIITVYMLLCVVLLVLNYKCIFDSTMGVKKSY